MDIILIALYVYVLPGFICFMVTWMLTKTIGNSPESKMAVAKVFQGFGIVFLIAFILYVIISYIFNLNNGTQINWIPFGGSSIVPFRETDTWGDSSFELFGSILIGYNIFQFIYVKYLKYKPIYDSMNINDSSQTQSKNCTTDDSNTKKIEH